MGVSVNLNTSMLMKEMFPMMLVLSLACKLAAHDYYFMQLPPIHLLSAPLHVPTCWSVPYSCTFHLYYGLGPMRRHSLFGARILNPLTLPAAKARPDNFAEIFQAKA